MIRISEIVLPGHPDKFCDQIADAIIAECVKIDSDAYGQIEVAVWSCDLWINGGICTRKPFTRDLRDIIIETGVAIGFVPGNHIDASRYTVHSALCQTVDDPAQFTAKVNDQSIVIGWAGYDENTHWLPPEHYIAHVFREALIKASRRGPLAGQGPDGKIMVRIREEGHCWIVEHVLVTIQQLATARFLDVCDAVASTLEDAYQKTRDRDPRWAERWQEIGLTINPNGPLVEAGSNGDNGQTGRKLVMDFYGPRIPIGGGALSGKHMTHIDRIGAYAARHAAICAVRSGASECSVRVAYAPNTHAPLDVSYDMSGRGKRQPTEFFTHNAAASRYPAECVSTLLAQGTHFIDMSLPWNLG